MEELRTENALLLQKFEHVEDAGAKVFRRDIATMEAGLKSWRHRNSIEISPENEKEMTLSGNRVIARMFCYLGISAFSLTLVAQAGLRFLMLAMCFLKKVLSRLTPQRAYCIIAPTSTQVDWQLPKYFRHPNT